MTDKELRKMSRKELLELLLEQIEENERLTAQLERYRQRMKKQEIVLDNAGSIAEAALELHHIFAAYPVRMDLLRTREMAQTLSAYAQRDALSPTAVGETDADGNLTFSDLVPGVYLLTGELYEQEGILYTAEPALIALQGDETVYPKYDMETPADDAVAAQRGVYKIWEDDGAEELRPSAITVQLLKDGEVYDEKELGEDNDWSFAWAELDEDAIWALTEQVPDGYDVLVEQEGDAFFVINYPADEVMEQQTSMPYLEYAASSGSSDEEDLTEQLTEDKAYLDGERLPQTGQLWWPVPVLIAAGLRLLLVGCIRSRKGGSK